MSEEARQLIGHVIGDDQEEYRRRTVKKFSHPHPTKDEIGVFWIPADADIPMQYKIIEPTQREMMSLVGGWLELVKLPKKFPLLDCGCHVIMVVDEEAKMKNQPVNDRATLLVPGQVVAGNAFLVAEGPAQNDGEEVTDYIGLPPEYHYWEGPGNDVPTSS